MRDQMQQRLEELRGEFEAGNRAQAELDARRDELAHTMLRIHGAIQVLTELLAVDETERGDPLSQQMESHTTVRRMVVG